MSTEPSSRPKASGDCSTLSFEPRTTHNLLRWLCRRGVLRRAPARGAFDVARASPFGEGCRIITADIADDGVQLAHGLHAARHNIVNGGCGGDGRARLLPSALDELLCLRYPGVEIIKKACGQAALDKLCFHRLGILRGGARGGD